MILAVLVDLNIIVDFFNRRQFHDEAATIMDLATDKKIGAFVSAHEVTTLAYFLGTEPETRPQIRRMLSKLMSIFEILPVDRPILEKALLSSIPDYEDAVLEAAAQSRGLNYIVTRNLKDFEKSAVQAVNPKVFLELFGREG